MMLAGGTNPSPDDVMVGKKRQPRRPAKQETDEDEEEEEEEDEEDKEDNEEKSVSLKYCSAHWKVVLFQGCDHVRVQVLI